MTVDRQSFWRRHRWMKWVARGMLTALAIAAAVVGVALKRAEPFVRAHCGKVGGSLSRTGRTG